MRATEFKRRSNEIWDAMAVGWDERHAYLEETTRPVTALMLDRLAPEPGATILDVAAGTGVVGFAAAALVGPTGRVIVGDFAPAMVEAARRRAVELGLENVECRVLDAEQLALDDDSVDGVTCRWGYMLMADPAAALAESRRVLRDGGRLSCAVFAGPEMNQWAALPAGVLQEHGHLAPPEPGTPGILALGDPARLRTLLEGAGFREPRIEEVDFTWRFASADEYSEFLSGAAGAVAMVLSRLADDERERVRADVATRAEQFAAAGELRMPARCLVASAA